MAFWIYWLAASIGVKAGQTGWTRFAGVRFGVILIILLLLRVRAIKGHAATNDPWWQGIGLAVFLLGLALAIWARLYLGRNWGMPMSQKVDPELVTTGPYRSIRRAIVEERTMARLFPDSYPEYKRSTKILIPFILWASAAPLLYVDLIAG